MEDGKIIELYWLRDQEAITQTDMKYGRLCRSISLNIVSDPRDSEECVADSYMAAWNSMPPQCPRSLKAWLAAVVRKLSLMRLRNSKNLQRAKLKKRLDKITILRYYQIALWAKAHM